MTRESTRTKTPVTKRSTTTTQTPMDASKSRRTKKAVTRAMTKANTKTSSRPTRATPANVRQGIQDTDYVLMPLTRTFAGKAVYRVTHGGCVNYIDNALMHVVFENDQGTFVVFRLDGAPVSNATLQACAMGLTKRRNKSVHVSVAPDVLLLQGCRREMDLTAAQSRLMLLNQELQKKCPNMVLRLAPFYDYLEEGSAVVRYNDLSHVCLGCRFYETLILSLCKRRPVAPVSYQDLAVAAAAAAAPPTTTIACISSIEITVLPIGHMSISSKTDPQEEGKKYNKLLRSVAVVVAANLPGVTRMESAAFNPVSAWLLLKYHRAVMTSEDAATLPEDVTQEDIRQWYALRGKTAFMSLLVPVTSEVAEKANQEFLRLVNTEQGELVCG